MATSSVNFQSSRYVSGGTTEVNPLALEWWERSKFAFDQSDTLFQIDETTAGRIDLIAHKLLGDSHLWWLIAQYNSILDVYGEITVGRILRVPTQARAKSMLNGQLGGVDSKRVLTPSKLGPIVL